VVFQSGSNVEKQIALSLVFKAMLSPQADFLGDPRDAEGLAGEARAKNVMLRDTGNRYGVDVPNGSFSKIGRVRLLTESVPIGRKHALRARMCEGDVETADPTKQVKKS
jgi:hypothetical protein